jgi:hypothetical protein
VLIFFRTYLPHLVFERLFKAGTGGRKLLDTIKELATDSMDPRLALLMERSEKALLAKCVKLMLLLLDIK